MFADLGPGQMIDLDAPSRSGVDLIYSHRNVRKRLRHRLKRTSMLVEHASLYAYVMNNPLNLVDPSGMISCRCGESVAQVYAVGPIDAYIARGLADEAQALAQREAPNLPGGRDGLHNGAADAFRHCYWSCRMAQEIGATDAKMVGDVHEACGNNPKSETAMDQANNAFGRSVGTPGTDCRNACLIGVADGSLQLSPGGTLPGGSYYPPRNDHYY